MDSFASICIEGNRQKQSTLDVCIIDMNAKTNNPSCSYEKATKTYTLKLSQLCQFIPFIVSTSVFGQEAAAPVRHAWC